MHAGILHAHHCRGTQLSLMMLASVRMNAQYGVVKLPAVHKEHAVLQYIIKLIASLLWPATNGRNTNGAFHEFVLFFFY